MLAREHLTKRRHELAMSALAHPLIVNAITKVERLE